MFHPADSAKKDQEVLDGYMPQRAQEAAKIIRHISEPYSLHHIAFHTEDCPINWLRRYVAGMPMNTNVESFNRVLL